MKLLITGISGLLGLNAALQLKDVFEVSGCYYSHRVCVPGIQTFPTDVTSYEEVGDVLEKIHPDVILHTAGMTSVDLCEENPHLAYRLNVRSAENIARLTGSEGIRLVHISTDHLFGGREMFVNEGAKPNPLNVYAETKRDAERVVQRYSPEALIVRTNFYGWGTRWRKSFSDWILDGLRNHQDLAMFPDVFFTPILINDLIDIIFDLVRHQASGVYHVAGRERISKFFFALQLAELFGYSRNGIRAISVDEAPLKAKRPKDMSLSSEKVAGLRGRQMPGVVEGMQRLRALYEQGWPAKLDRAVEPSAGIKTLALPGRMQG